MSSDENCTIENLSNVITEKVQNIDLYVLLIDSALWGRKITSDVPTDLSSFGVIEKLQWSAEALRELSIRIQAVYEAIR